MIVAFLTCSGSMAWAYFTDNTAARGTLTTVKVSVRQTGFETIAPTYLNSSIPTPGSVSLSSTQSFSVTNDGAQAGNLKLSLSSTATLATQLTVDVWRTTNATTCASGPGTTVTTRGTWANLTYLESQTLAPKATVVYCLRTAVTNRNLVASTTRIGSAPGTLTASLEGTGWAPPTSTAAATQTFDSIYPLDTTIVKATGPRWFKINTPDGRCLAATTGTSSTSEVVYTETCISNSRQSFEAMPIGGNTSFVTFRPLNALVQRLAWNPTTNTYGLAAVNNSDVNQRWYLQRASDTLTQWVNAGSGLCAAYGPNGVAITPVACSSPADHYRMQWLPIESQTAYSYLQVKYNQPNETTLLDFQYSANGSTWQSAPYAYPILVTDHSHPWIDTSAWAPGDYQVRIVIKGTNQVYASGLSIRVSLFEVEPLSGFTPMG